MSTPSHFAETPAPPYFAVIFSSQRSARDDGYEAMAAHMLSLAAAQPGFLGVESVRGADGFGITVSYWDSLQSIAAWREHSEHQAAQDKGKRDWYQRYELRIAKVERASLHAP